MIVVDHGLNRRTLQSMSRCQRVLQLLIGSGAISAAHVKSRRLEMVERRVRGAGLHPEGPCQRVVGTWVGPGDEPAREARRRAGKPMQDAGRRCVGPGGWWCDPDLEIEPGMERGDNRGRSQHDHPSTAGVTRRISGRRWPWAALLTAGTAAGLVDGLY